MGKYILKKRGGGGEKGGEGGYYGREIHAFLSRCARRGGGGVGTPLSSSSVFSSPFLPFPFPPFDFILKKKRSMDVWGIL